MTLSRSRHQFESGWECHLFFRSRGFEPSLSEQITIGTERMVRMREKTTEKEKAITLRQDGKSLRDISKILGVAKSSVSTWVRHVKLSEDQIKELFCNSKRLCFGNAEKTKRCITQRQEACMLGAEKTINKDPLHLMGCMLYWAEGSKRGGEVQFCNTDSEMVSLFVKFLKDSLDVPVSKISIKTNVYLNNGLSLEEIEIYWLKKLNLPTTALRKSCVNHMPKSSSGKSKIKHPYGVCTVTVCDTLLVQHIFGAIQAYADFKRNEWLTIGMRSK